MKQFTLNLIQKDEKGNWLLSVIVRKKYGFFWLKTKFEPRMIFGSGTVWYDFYTGVRIDPSPLSKFAQEQVILHTRPTL